MIVIGRRVIPLDDLPGQTVTMGPLTWEELQAYKRKHGADLMDPTNLFELVVSHIEAHPFDVVNPREIEIMTLVPIIERWTQLIVASAPMPMRGRRH